MKKSNKKIFFCTRIQMNILSLVLFVASISAKDDYFCAQFYFIFPPLFPPKKMCFFFSIQLKINTIIGSQNSLIPIKRQCIVFMFMFSKQYKNVHGKKK